MRPIEVEAKSVEEAIELASRQLNTSKELLDIDILDNGHGKLLSFFSGKKARIRASLRSSADSSNSPDDALDVLKESLLTIARAIHADASVEIRQERGETILDIMADGSGIFIGKKGQTLEALNYIINKIRLKQFRECSPVTVDSENYRTRHIRSLISLADRLSSKAKKRNGPVTTNPLNASDRRIIHMALKKDTELTTWSKGEGSFRKVIIAPKQ